MLGLSAIGWLSLLLAAQPAWAQFSGVNTEASLVSLWQLNEAVGSSTVSATNANPIYNGAVFAGTTLGGASAMTTLGTAANFNGSNGKIDVPFSATLNTPNYTVEAWAQVTGGSGHRSPLTSRGDLPQEGYIFYATPAASSWEYWSGPGWNVNTGPAVNNNQWVHLAGTYDSVSDVKVFYVNGHPVSTNVGVINNPNDSTPLRIGAGATEGPGAFFFQGNVDNVAVMNAAVSHQQVANHFNAMSNYANRVATDTPVAFYRLGEQSGASAYNSMNVAAGVGTYSNTTLRQTNAGIVNNVDTAALFNGSTSKMSVPYTATNNPTGDFTIEAWARSDVTTNGTFRSVVTSRNGDNFSGYVIYAGNENNWEFWTGNGSTWNEMTSNKPVEVGEWVHLVGTYDADTGTKSFYVDGELAATLSGIDFDSNTVDPFHIGAGADLGNSFFFLGGIDDVAVYNYVLSAGSIADHYRTGISGQFVQTPEPASIALWLLLGVGLVGCGWRWRR
jgi:hypothetical protein